MPLTTHNIEKNMRISIAIETVEVEIIFVLPPFVCFFAALTVPKSGESGGLNADELKKK